MSNAMLNDMKYAKHSFGDNITYTVLAIAHANNTLEGGDDFRSKTILSGYHTLTEAMNNVEDVATLAMKSFLENPTLEDWTPSIVGCVVFRKNSEGAEAAIATMWTELSRYAITQEPPEGAIPLPCCLPENHIWWITHLDTSFTPAELSIARDKSAFVVERERPITDPFWNFQKYEPHTNRGYGKSSFFKHMKSKPIGELVGIRRSELVAALGIPIDQIQTMVSKGFDSIKYGSTHSFQYFHDVKVKGQKHTIVFIYELAANNVENVYLVTEAEAAEIKKALDNMK